MYNRSIPGQYKGGLLDHYTDSMPGVRGVQHARGGSSTNGTLYTNYRELTSGHKKARAAITKILANSKQLLVFVNVDCRLKNMLAKKYINLR